MRQMTLREVLDMPEQEKKDQMDSSLKASLKMMQWNSCGYSSMKRDELGHFADDRHIEVICLAELGGWWDVPPPPPPGFILAGHCDKGRQSCIFVRKGLDYEPIELEAPNDDENDILFNAIQVGTVPPLTVVNIYIRPTTTSLKRRAFFQLLLDQLQGTDFLLTGDWNDCSKTFSLLNNKSKSPLDKLMTDYHLHVVNDDSVTFPCSQSTLDVAVASEKVECAWTTFQELSSDHNPCTMEVLSHSITPSQYKESGFYELRNDWPKLVRRVHEFCLDWNSAWPSAALPALVKEIKQAQRQRPIGRNKCTWWSPAMKQLKRQRNLARKQGNWDRYRKLKGALRRMYRKGKRKDRERTIKNIATADHPWKLLYKLRPDLKRRSHQPQKPALPSRSKANDIAASFSAVLNDPTTSSAEAELEYSQCLSSLETSAETWRYDQITPTEVFTAAKRANTNSTPGVDRISAKVWNRLVEDDLFLHFLTKQFNLLFRGGDYPDFFKESIVVHVLKESGGFRPISLLSCLGKIYDRVLTERIYREWCPRKEQFGCRKGHSAQDALALLLHQSSMAHVSNQCFGALFLDFSKAYDRVCHSRLIMKLHRYGLSSASASYQ